MAPQRDEIIKQKVNDCVQYIILQKSTNFHAIRSLSFRNICNEIGWPVAPFLLRHPVYYTGTEENFFARITNVQSCRWHHRERSLSMTDTQLNTLHQHHAMMWLPTRPHPVLNGWSPLSVATMTSGVGPEANGTWPSTINWRKVAPAMRGRERLFKLNQTRWKTALVLCKMLFPSINPISQSHNSSLDYC